MSNTQPHFANSACKLNSSGAKPIRGQTAMTVETEATTIKAKAMTKGTPKILLTQQGRLELPKGISVHPVTEQNHFRKCRGSGGIFNSASAIFSDTLLAINFHTDVTCEEVCVCCFKVFRLVSEFVRHAAKHNGTCERKWTFIRKTSDELREKSDKQLALAMSQYSSRVVVGKKRKWDVANLGFDISGARAETDRIGMTALDKSFCYINEGDSLHQLHSARIELSAAPNPTQSPITLPRLAIMADPINPSSTPSMFAEEIYFNPAEGQNQGLDLLQDFDAPILQIMNSIPALTTGWAAQDDIVDMTTEIAAYQEQ
ncbi:hypothetical protein N7466_001469 [Penicillium verhagenii]|uniref:uncharacterized protein n=1 Tax=Penicillium verhagenii TaxID=1562060 RepID=UPI002544FA22|nr:uncharacterized protein N7466_001469 [Penicillium verhagenii]KAJ5938335.1 hypothetical protein N7466_001469 [Penicillium verhagenii]